MKTTDVTDAVALYEALVKLYQEGGRVEIITPEGERVDPIAGHEV
jgi:hypothetical protein